MGFFFGGGSCFFLGLEEEQTFSFANVRKKNKENSKKKARGFWGLKPPQKTLPALDGRIWLARINQVARQQDDEYDLMEVAIGLRIPARLVVLDSRICDTS